MISLHTAQDLFRKKLVLVLRRTPPSIRPCTEYLSEALGKNLRGDSLLLSASDEKSMVSEEAVNLAVAIELFHLATLIHDDIIDDADKRRGRKSLAKKFDKKTAVICGDYLLAMAVDLAMGIEFKDEYKKYTLVNYAKSVCLGELRQDYNLYNYNLTTKKYLTIIRGKTAALFEAAFVSGAILLGESRERVAIYKKIGRYIGMIFQMSDDCMDYELKDKDSNKPVLSDISNGVITLPLIYALQKVPSLRSKMENGLDHDILAEEVLSSGGIEYAKSFTTKYYEKTLAQLHKLELAPTKHQMIREILDKAARR